MLLNRALSYGAKIRGGVELASLRVEKDSRPAARLTSGEVIEADVIIGADGAESYVRTLVADKELQSTPKGLALFKYVAVLSSGLESSDLVLFLPVLEYRKREWQRIRSCRR